jgi:hypothetical protein
MIDRKPSVAGSRRAGALAAVALASASTLLTALVFEFVVFRYVLPAPNLLVNAYVDDIIKYEPNQRVIGNYNPRIEWQVNDAGWNSGHATYTRARTPGISRIAIIGDSFVDARQVNFDQSLAERLERKLGTDRYEVYRFGIPAAPLSQYLHILRREALAYHPDVVIVLLVHNDFDESYKINLGSYPESFLRFDIDHDGRITEVSPHAFHHPWWWRFVRLSATYRYLVDYRGLNVQRVRDWMNAARLGHEYQANIEVTGLLDRSKADRAVTRYAFGEFLRLSREHGFQLLFMIDGDRHSIYRGEQSKVLSLNAMAADEARLLALPFIDLEPVFERDWAAHRKPFNDEPEAHWNDYGHEVAAQALYNYLTHESSARAGDDSSQ